jgi:multicomponent Na+:H+ antiporter subunit G
VIATLLPALSALLLAAGGVLLLIAAWGVNTLPDALSRQHAATKAGTLALALVGLGAAAAVPQWDWGWRLVLIIGFLLATLPVASHLLARAAVREAALDAQTAAAPRVGDDPAAH